MKISGVGLVVELSHVDEHCGVLRAGLVLGMVLGGLSRGVIFIFRIGQKTGLT